MKNLSVLVCHHVAGRVHPIRYACRDDPLDDLDSGWQVICTMEEEDEELAQTWAVNTLLALDPSLEPFLELPVGTELTRSADGGWLVKDSILEPGSECIFTI